MNSRVNMSGQTRRGFTLIEVLVALSIFALAVVALARTFWSYQSLILVALVCR